tara:strand:+ start:259 stop:639 length:381 start_codon:yes stop_codon:yes gene_type:complete
MTQTKEERIIVRKNYYQKNKEKIKERQQKWREKNRKQEMERSKINSQTEKGIKSSRISRWKQRGIIDEDLSAVYDYYIKQTNCMICLTEFRNSKERNLDHDHLTGEIRYICCRGCNTNLLREKNIS